MNAPQSGAGEKQGRIVIEEGERLEELKSIGDEIQHYLSFLPIETTTTATTKLSDKNE